MPAVSKIINGRTWINGLGDSVSTWGLGGGQAAINWFEMMGDVLTQITLERQTTSTTSLAVGSGSKVFTLAANANFPIGAVVVAAVTASPATNYMFGVVTAYNAGTPSVTLSVAADGFGGSGTYAAWTLSVAGQKGQTGAGVPSMAGHANKVLSNNGGTADFRFTELQYAQSNSLTPTFSANITLTASSEMMQVLAPTVAGLSVTLPDATTLLKHPERFVLLNSGDFEVAVRDSAGTLITCILPGGRARMALTDVSTAAGAWFASGDKLSPIWWQTVNTPISGGMSHQIVASLYLSETLCVFISNLSTGATIYATAYDISSNTLGSTTSLGSIGNGVLAAHPVDSTHGIVAGSDGKIVAFSVSGTTVTAGNIITGENTIRSLLVMSASSFIVFSVAGATARALGLTLSGETLTAGAVNTIHDFTTGAAQYALIAPVKRSATQAIVVVLKDGAVAKAVHVSVSGTAITANSNIDFTTGLSANLATGNTCSNLVFMATDEWWCFYQTAANDLAVGKITVSGTVLSFTKGAAVVAGGSNMNFMSPGYYAPCAAKLPGTKIMGHIAIGASSREYIGTMTTLAAATSGGLALEATTALGNPTNNMRTAGDWAGYCLAYNSTASSDSTALIYFDESATGDRLIARAAASINLVDWPGCLEIIRMPARDFIIGGMAQSQPNNPGVGLMLDRAGKQQFVQFYIPYISGIYSGVAYGYPNLVHIGQAKVTFGGNSGGLVYCFEVCQ